MGLGFGPDLISVVDGGWMDGRTPNSFLNGTNSDFIYGGAKKIFLVGFGDVNSILRVVMELLRV